MINMKKTLHVYDLDDTLIRSTTRIKLVHIVTGETKAYYTHEKMDVNKSDYYFDYSEFADLELLKKSTLNKLIYDDLKQKELTNDVAIMTARGERDVVIEYLKYIDINLPEHLIYTVGDALKGTMGNAPLRKKEAFIKLIEMGYNHFYFYDDSLANLEKVKTLETAYDVTINSIQIK